MLELHLVLISSDLIIYECICQCVFIIMILVRRYEQDTVQ